MKSTEDLKQLRMKSLKDLSLELKKHYKKLHELKFDAEFRKNKNVKSINIIKKSIARTWTVMGEKIEENTAGNQAARRK